MKKIGRYLILTGFAFFIVQGNILADEVIVSEATIEFYQQERGQLRIVEEESAFDLSFGSHAINDELHRNGLSVSEQLGNRHLTVEDLSGNLGGWTLRVEKSPFTNRETGQALNSQVVFSPSRYESTTGNVWGTSNGIWLDAGDGWGGSSNVFSGALGIHTLFWDDISLNLWPGQVIQDGVYASTLTWTLGVVPHQNETALGGE